MTKISKKLKFFIDMTRAEALIARAFDRNLGGLGFTWFIILYYLSQAPDERMRRVDLAEKVALTASGITRILLPMEKIGLVKREESDIDGRVSFVKLAPGGKRMLEESIERVEYLSEELLPSTEIKTKDMSEIFSNFSLGEII